MFSFLKPENKEAIASFVLDIKADQKRIYHTELTEDEKFRQVPYIAGYNKFLLNQVYRPLHRPGER
jgi:hypothetical protein